MVKVYFIPSVFQHTADWKPTENKYEEFSALWLYFWHMCTTENKRKDKKTLTLNTVKYNRLHKRLLILVYAKHQALLPTKHSTLS